MLAELVEVVIGVDTHKHTHTAAVVAAGTGAVLAQTTVPTDPNGYAALIERTARCGPGRWKARAATGPVWPRISPSARSWSSSSTAPPDRPAARAPSPTPSTARPSR